MVVVVVYDFEVFYEVLGEVRVCVIIVGLEVVDSSSWGCVFGELGVGWGVEVCSVCSVVVLV